MNQCLTEKSKERSACPRAPRSACPRARAQLPPLWLLSLHGSPWFQMVTEVDPKKAYSCAKLDTWAATRGGFVRGRPTFYAAHRVSPAARATDPCRCMCASYATAFVHQDTGSTTLQDSTCREPFVWQRCHEHVHVICVILQLRSAGRCYPMTSRPACASPSSGVARDGMPSRFLTASHCVSHLLLHSACVMRMCCGVGLSMWQVYLTTPPTSTTSLEYSILYELRRHHRRHGSHLVHVIFIVHYVPAGSHTARTPHTAMPPKNRKSRQRMFAS